MARWSGFGKETCESFQSIDVRRWHRLGYFTSGCRFLWTWTFRGGLTARIGVTARRDEVVLSYSARRRGGPWKPVEQHIPISWSACTLGGQRPWFLCTYSSGGGFCGRRVAKLYGAADFFACRHCYRLTYVSQQEGPLYRGCSQAQKIRERLGGSGNLGEEFPPKPKGMHWRTYLRLEAKAMEAEARSMAFWDLRLNVG